MKNAERLQSSCKRCRVISEETKQRIGKASVGRHHSDQTKDKLSTLKMGDRNPNYGIKLSEEVRIKMSGSQLQRYNNREERKRTSDAITIAMHRPDVRKRHIAGLLHSKWLNVRTDKGQLELLDKWNRLGFKFEPNYQVHTDTDLFYIDGYDMEHNVVLEYDSKYHNKYHQQQKDLVRQQKIIDLLHPKKFWRYNSVKKQCENVLEKEG